MINNVVCDRAENYLKTIPSNFVDMIITSPPYGDLRKYDGFTWNFEEIANESFRVLKQGGVMVWVEGDRIVRRSETLEPMKHAIYFKDCVGFLMHDTMIYHRTTPINENRYKQEFEFMFVLSKGIPKTIHLQKQLSKYPSKPNKKAGTRAKDNSLQKTERYFKPHHYRVMPNIWYIPHGYNTTKDKQSFQHPATFPEKLAMRHILSWSNKGDLVLDFFMGSGTTAKMAKLLKRNYMGCDISQNYVDLTLERLNTL